MRLFAALRAACAVLLVTITAVAQDNAETNVSHDLAGYVVLTKDGVDPRPICWYIGTDGSSVWQITCNFEAQDSISAKFGKNVKVGRVTFTPQAGMVVGKTNDGMGELWTTFPISKKVSVFNLTQGRFGLGKAESFAYTETSVAWQAHKKFSLEVLGQAGAFERDKPLFGAGVGVKITPFGRQYFVVQSWGSTGGPKLVLGTGFKF